MHAGLMCDATLKLPSPILPMESFQAEETCSAILISVTPWSKPDYMKIMAPDKSLDLYAKMFDIGSLVLYRLLNI